LRRGILYRVAKELGATRIALGHHRDDILATFFLNLFYGGKLKSMPPKLVSDDGAHVVIRPLAYVREADLIEYAAWREFPIIPCNLCGSQDNLKRREVGRMLSEWEKRHPGRVENIFSALGSVTPSHLLDRRLFDFASIAATGLPDPEGDIGFDVDRALEQAIDQASNTPPDAVQALRVISAAASGPAAHDGPATAGGTPIGALAPESAEQGSPR
jgi:tRNA 2-thiocytidine biosynthesis protein TtcA